jgi:hypothetical protein
MNGQKWYYSNCKNVLPHTKMAGRDKNGSQIAGQFANKTE